MVVVVSFNLALPVYIMFAFSIACLDYVCIKHCLCIHNACICHTARSTTDTVMISSISLHLIQSTLPSVLLKQCVDWLELFMTQSEPLCFQFTKPGSCTNTRVFLSAHTDGQREDREEQLADFDKQRIGLMGSRNQRSGGTSMLKSSKVIPR